MLYYYFKSKEKLFHQVIEHCYADLVASEEALDLDFTRPRKALADLVAFNWDYYWAHPELLSILARELEAPPGEWSREPRAIGHLGGFDVQRPVTANRVAHLLPTISSARSSSDSSTNNSKTSLPSISTTGMRSR